MSAASSYDATSVSHNCAVCGCAAFSGHYTYCWSGEANWTKRGHAAGHVEMSEGCAALVRYAYLTAVHGRRSKEEAERQQERSASLAVGRRPGPPGKSEEEITEECGKVRVCTTCFRGRETTAGGPSGGGIYRCFCGKCVWGEVSLEEATEGLCEWLAEHGKEAVVTEFETLDAKRPPYPEPEEEEEDEEADD